jgi:hypothetical protein
MELVCRSAPSEVICRCELPLSLFVSVGSCITYALEALVVLRAEGWMLCSSCRTLSCREWYLPLSHPIVAFRWSSTMNLTHGIRSVVEKRRALPFKFGCDLGERWCSSKQTGNISKNDSRSLFSMLVKGSCEGGLVLYCWREKMFFR